jgi:hypothetical protein
MASSKGSVTPELAAFQTMQENEWGVYTATRAITIDGVRAFN